MWARREVRLSPRARGFHLVTEEIADGLPELADVGVGLVHVFIRHTSAALCLGENASAEVR
ncbi:MAG: YjbQ family protein, partial [Thermoleophilaceae bacterium]|nr:YjbQ family protein [Thermoleophilaceae bacterium]